MVTRETERRRASRAAWFQANKERANATKKARRARARQGLPPVVREPAAVAPPLERLSGADFAAWLSWARQYRGWNVREAARQLGCARDTVRAWKTNGAPRHVGLACAALTRGFAPWQAPEAPKGDA